jgi:hypothetical protein
MTEATIASDGPAESGNVTAVSTSPYGHLLTATAPKRGEPLPFFGRAFPQGDFLLVWGAAVGKITELNGMRKARWAGAEIFHSLNVDRLGHGLLIGLRKQGGALIYGPRTLTQAQYTLYDSEERIGQYLLVGLLPEGGDGPERIVITGDDSGMVPMFIARMHGSVLLSNHLHLLVRALHAAGLPVRLSKASIAANWVSEMTMFLQQVVPETYVENVLMTMPGDSMICSSQRFEHKFAANADTTPVTKDEYWDLIREGAKEIRSNIEAAANSGIPLISTMTGGRDSRMFYAGLRAAGLERTTPFMTNPGDQADVEVASGLVSRVGGHFGVAPTDGNGGGADPVTALLYHRSAFLGSYGPIKKLIYQNPGHARYQLLVGGFGEAYRAYYPNRYDNDLMHLPFSGESVRTWLLSHPFWGDRPPEFFDLALNAFTQHLASLPGDKLHQKLSNQFVRFENRIHFGMEAAGRHYPSILFFPLHAPSLLKLAPRVDFEAMRLGTIVFHVARELCEEAPYLPYNLPAPNVAEHPFHTRCRYDDTPPDFSPDMALFQMGKGGERRTPVDDLPTEEDYAAAILSMMEEVIAELRDHPEGQTYLTPGLVKRAFWLKNKPTHAHRTWLSRLSAVRDVLCSSV